MVLIGILLVAAGAAVTIDFLVENAGRADVQIFGTTITGVRIGDLMMIGAACGLVCILGLLLMRDSAARRRRLRAERRELTAERDQRTAERSGEIRGPASAPVMTSSDDGGAAQPRRRWLHRTS